MSDLRALIVDDEPSNRLLLSYTLRLGSFKIDVVESGQEAVTHIDQEHIDLLLADLELPDMSGLAVVRHLREQNQQAQILIVTASDSMRLMEQACKAGANAYLVKPFPLSQLSQFIQGLDFTQPPPPHQLKILDARFPTRNYTCSDAL
jgi:CheY-like chemotaxis protein